MPRHAYASQYWPSPSSSPVMPSEIRSSTNSSASVKMLTRRPSRRRTEKQLCEHLPSSRSSDLKGFPKLEQTAYNIMQEVASRQEPGQQEESRREVSGGTLQLSSHPALLCLRKSSTTLRYLTRLDGHTGVIRSPRPMRRCLTQRSVGCTTSSARRE